MVLGSLDAASVIEGFQATRDATRRENFFFTTGERYCKRGILARPLFSPQRHKQLLGLFIFFRRPLGAIAPMLFFRSTPILSSLQSFSKAMEYTKNILASFHFFIGVIGQQLIIFFFTDFRTDTRLENTNSIKLYILSQTNFQLMQSITLVGMPFKI